MRWRRGGGGRLWLLRAAKIAEGGVVRWWGHNAPPVLGAGAAGRLIFTDTAAKDEHIRRAGLAVCGEREGKRGDVGGRRERVRVREREREVRREGD